VTVEKKYSSIEDRNEANIHFDYGLTFLMQGKLDKAIVSLNKAIEFDPYFAEAYNNLGDIYMKKGMFETALASYEKSRDLKSEIENTHFDLGCVYALLRRYEESLEEFRTALEMDPDHYEIYGRIGSVYLEIGGVERIIRRNIGISFKVDLTGTSVKFIEDSLPNLLKALRHDPTDMPARFHAARALLGLGRKDEAAVELAKVVERYRSLLEVKKNYAEGHYFVGKACYYLGDFAAAIENLSKAIELDTPEIDYHYALGLAYHDAEAHAALGFAFKAAGRKAEAFAQAEKALSRDPGCEEAKALLAEMQ
jgi:tetratricopeptide (TPR) repeat protein